MTFISTHKQFIKFCLIGASTASLDFVILNSLHGILGVNLIISNTASTLIAIVINFFLNRKWTFNYAQKDNQTLKFLQFLTVSLTGLVLNDIILYILSEKFSLNYNLGKLTATCILVFWNFYLNKLWTFSKFHPTEK